MQDLPLSMVYLPFSVMKLTSYLVSTVKRNKKVKKKVLLLLKTINSASSHGVLILFSYLLTTSLSEVA